MDLTLPVERVRRARNAVFLAFFGSGFGFASWASRIPDTKAHLGLTPGGLSWVLLVAAFGSVIGLPIAGRLIVRFGSTRVTQSAALINACGLLIASGGVAIVRVEVVMAGMLLSGIGIGVWDVAMNHEGAMVERLGGRSIMPWFHAMFSAATVVAALAGAAMTALRVPVIIHIWIAVALILAAALVAARGFLPSGSDAHDVPTGDPSAPPARVRSPWTEPKTLLIGLVACVAAFTEGTANDWIALAMTTGHHLPNWAGVLGFATFLTSMTIGRVAGVRILDRYGRVPVLLVMFVLAGLGSLMVVFGTPALAFAGALLWGLGASLGFPVGVSAASDDPRRAAARLSTVSTIAYLAFLGGPPLLGFLGDHIGILHSLLVVGALAVPAILALPAVRPPADDQVDWTVRRA